MQSLPFLRDTIRQPDRWEKSHTACRADIQGSHTTMSVRDLLTFNLFLQFADGLVSYQAFALGAAEANPVVAAAMVNWGMIGG